MKARIACAALALAGCQSGLSRPFVWDCPRGESFQVRFDQAGAAVVSARGHEILLQRETSASGARYSNGAIEFWEHQGEATLAGLPDGDLRGCRVQ